MSLFCYSHVVNVALICFWALRNQMVDVKQGQTGCCFFMKVMKVMISEQHFDHINISADHGEEPLWS